MNRVNEFHQQAMDLAEQAFAAKRHNDPATELLLTYRAYQLEQEAAILSKTEPTRSVLHRSAATLALNCGEYREAERLAGSPPTAIANELREVLNAVYKAWNWREQTVAA